MQKGANCLCLRKLYLWKSEVKFPLPKGVVVL